MRLINVDKSLTERLASKVLPMLPGIAAVVFNRSKVVICRRRRGVARHKSKVAIIPSWVFEDEINFCGKGLIPGGNEFAAYYLAHELAHLMANESGHNKKFYECFKALCPPNLQHYEFKYKPKVAAANGVNAA